MFIAAREFARSLIARGAPGSLVTIASVDGLRSAQNHGSYGAAKAGLVSLVKTMAQEWAPHGIRANCVAPGGVATPRIPLGSPEQEAAGMAAVPMKRRATTDEFAKAVTFFLSDMAIYVTGQTLAVDELAVWARNLTDNKDPQFPLAVPFTASSSFQQARSFGLDLIVKY